MGPGMQVPEHLKNLALKCFEEGGTEEKCRKRLSEAMFQQMMDCDEQNAQEGGEEDVFRKCTGMLKQQFNLPSDAFPIEGSDGE